MCDQGAQSVGNCLEKMEIMKFCRKTWRLYLSRVGREKGRGSKVGEEGSAFGETWRWKEAKGEQRQK